MPTWLEFLLAVFTATMASGGFWAYLDHRSSKKNATTRAILGLLHEQIMSKGNEYIAKGSISIDDYNDFFTYFYDPYHDLGGNGTGERMADAIKKLPIN